MRCARTCGGAASPRTGPGWWSATARRAAGDWDLALLDPPYAFEDWSELLDVLAPAVAVCESGASIDVPDSWVVVREKAYGATVVAILRHEPPPEQEDPA